MAKLRRHFTGPEKVAILKRHLLDKVPISDLSDEYDIYPTQLYDWLKKFFENGHRGTPTEPLFSYPARGERTSSDSPSIPRQQGVRCLG